MTLEDAIETLYRAPIDQFVAERKRLAAELKTGDKAAAKALMERRRPTVSAWAVDQLHWQARAE
ncbi:MAG TPA: hypothetical protein VL463_07765, partial [Kofleriaceae bacterium]|nr:hypothetical protein [Kofleriaceae bacterium]